MWIEIQKENSEERHVQWKRLESGPIWIVSEKGSKKESITIWSDSL